MDRLKKHIDFSIKMKCCRFLNEQCTSSQSPTQLHSTIGTRFTNCWLNDLRSNSMMFFKQLVQQPQLL